MILWPIRIAKKHMIECDFGTLEQLHCSSWDCQALGRLGLGNRAHELQDALQAFTVPQLQQKNLTREDAQRCKKAETGVPIQIHSY